MAMQAKSDKRGDLELQNWCDRKPALTAMAKRSRLAPHLEVNLEQLVEYGRWDDLVALCDTPLEEATTSGYNAATGHRIGIAGKQFYKMRVPEGLTLGHSFEVTEDGLYPYGPIMAAGRVTSRRYWNEQNQHKAKF